MHIKLSRGIAIAVIVTAVILLIGILPFALKDVISDLSSESYPIYYLSSKNQPVTDKHMAVNMEFIGIDEWKGVAQIRVTAYDYCITPCNWTDELTFTSFFNQQPEKEALAPTETIQFSANHWSYTKEIELPIYGDPIRFPFDDYDMRVGVLYHRLYPDGRIETITPEMAKDQLSVTLQSRIPKFVMLDPKVINNLEVLIYNQYPQQYDYGADLTFERHSYLKILTVFLITLMAIITIYAVFLCEVKSVILSAGGLILGVWGIKAILLSDSHLGITASDVILAIIVLFLLLAILIRGVFEGNVKKAFSFLHKGKK